MKIQLPNGQDFILDESITIEEKLAVTFKLTEEWLTVIEENWENSNEVRFFLDGLSNYLVWHKEPEDNVEDKEVMSRNKTNRLYRGRKDIPFSCLSENDKELIFGEKGME